MKGGRAPREARPILRGLRFRGEAFVRVEAVLLDRAGADRWRARLEPAVSARVGDRLRFGETSESLACQLAFLDAEIVALSGSEALLSFCLTGPAFDEAIERLGEAHEP
jgi:S-adenosylmethionine:tRNA ribosyltransferase-isomerase